MGDKPARKEDRRYRDALLHINWAALTLDDVPLARATREVLFRLANGGPLNLDVPWPTNPRTG